MMGRVMPLMALTSMATSLKDAGRYLVEKLTAE
jgi:hypothetical protein